MKKIYFLSLTILFAGYGVYHYIQQVQNSRKMYSLMLENIEALAQDETDPNSRICFRDWRKAPDDDSLASLGLYL